MRKNLFMDAGVLGLTIAVEVLKAIKEKSEIPDPAFSGGMLGKCMGIIPDNGNVYAPCDGEVYMIAETKHAIGIMSDYGNDVLIHVGIDTISLGGKGFDVLVSENDRETKLDAADLTDGKIGILSIMVKAGLASSNGEARRLVQQGGISVDDAKVTDPQTSFDADALANGIVVKKGKKVFHKVTL